MNRILGILALALVLSAVEEPVIAQDMQKPTGPLPVAVWIDGSGPSLDNGVQVEETKKHKRRTRRRHRDTTRNPGQPGIKPLHWEQRQIPVLDFTDVGLVGYVPRMVDNWNFAGGGGVQLLYDRRAHTFDCVGVDEVVGAIVVCNHDENLLEGTDLPPECIGATGCTVRRGDKRPGVIIGAKITLAATAWGIPWDSRTGFWWHPLGCHEFGHSLGLDHPSDWQDATTCMSVRRQTPGSLDALQLYERYGGNGGVVTGTTPECCEVLELARQTGFALGTPTEGPKKKVHPKKTKGKKGNHGKKSRKKNPKPPAILWPPPPPAY